jgi:hypothetical protein
VQLDQDGRRSMEEESRSLPEGWVRQYDPKSDHQVRLCHDLAWSHTLASSTSIPRPHLLGLSGISLDLPLSLLLTIRRVHPYDDEQWQAENASRYQELQTEAQRQLEARRNHQEDEQTSPKGKESKESLGVRLKNKLSRSFPFPCESATTS